MFGKHVSEANKQKLREVHLGKRKSDETRYKMSLHHADFSGPNHYNAKSVKQYTWDCKFVAEYDCIKNAEKAVPHCDIYACVSGKTKQAGGYLWRSAEDEPPKEHYQKEEYKNGRTDCQNNGRKAETSDF